jgi:metal-sulfur cluster biosynthetic enzyme
MSETTPPQKLVWAADKDYPDLTEKLRTAFKEVLDPELGLNIIQLGLIRDVTISAESAMIKMILTTPFCPYGPAMMEVTRQKAEETLGRPTHMDFGLEPWDFSMMEEDASPDWGLFG